MDPFEAAEAPRNKGSALVVWAGLATTALTLAGVYFLNQAGANIMGWYVDYVIPVGALIVGMVAGSGYGVASWWSGTRITKTLLWVVLGLQIWAYFAAEYVEYKGLGLQGGFWTFFDSKARNIVWKQQNGAVGEPLGMWGYGIRFLELAGFAGGGLFAPLALLVKPYCEHCGVYMRSKTLGLLPAGIVPRKLKKGSADQAVYQEELSAAAARGQQLLEQARALAAEQKAEEFRAFLADHQGRQKSYNKLTQRILLNLSSCPECHAGFLKASLQSGSGKELKIVEIGRWNLDSAFVREVV